MPTNTYKPLASVTLANSALSVTFSSINQTYSDLIVVFTGSAPFTNAAYATFNGSSSAFYNHVDLRGDGTSASSGSSGSQAKMPVSGDTLGTTKGNFVLNIMDYSSTTRHKSTLSRSSNGAQQTNLLCGRSADTSAITSVTFTFGNGSSGFDAGSTFSLYGVIS